MTEAKRVVRIGLVAKAKDGRFQESGMLGRGFNMVVTAAEEKFLQRLSRKADINACAGNSIILVQDMGEHAS